MSGKDRGKGPVPEVSPSEDKLQKWVMRANGLSGACLCILIATELFDIATPSLRVLLMAGIAVGGTVSWIQQAGRKCPGCNHLYGYHLRFFKANICRKCGAEFPGWNAGPVDGEAEK